jgi:epoxyqueuosine reductase QueG
MNDQIKITVCDQCFMACCWQGIFMCENSKNAGTIEMTIAELKGLGFEHADYWQQQIRERG